MTTTLTPVLTAPAVKDALLALLDADDYDTLIYKAQTYDDLAEQVDQALAATEEELFEPALVPTAPSPKLAKPDKKAAKAQWIYYHKCLAKGRLPNFYAVPKKHKNKKHGK